MKTTKKSLMAMTLSAMTLLGSTPLTYAADYRVIKVGEVHLGDDGAREKGRFSFTLPDNFDTAQRVILQMRVRGATTTRHSVYLNPTNTSLSAAGTDGCREDSTTIPDLQANIDARIARIETHQTVDGSNEAFLQHQVLSGSKFKVGSNLLVICPRDANGKIDSPGNSADDATDVDDIFVSDIVLHFKTK